MRFNQCGAIPVWVPIPEIGERVEIVAGPYKGRNGVLVYLKDTMAQVKTDGGIELVELKADWIRLEKEPPAEVIPDIKCNDGMFPPEDVHEWQDAFERAGRMLLKRAELCKAIERKRELKEMAGQLIQMGQEAQRRFQAWSLANGPTSWKIITSRLQEIIDERERRMEMIKHPEKIGSSTTVVSWDQKASVIKHLAVLKEKGLDAYQHKQCLVVKDPQDKAGDLLGIGGIGGKYNRALNGWIFPVSKADLVLRRVVQALGE